MAIQLSDHFNYKKLLRFTLPSIIMMIFTSIYSIVDGFFVSNFAGKTPFAAINFIMPFLMILGPVCLCILRIWRNHRRHRASISKADCRRAWRRRRTAYKLRRIRQDYPACASRIYAAI